MTKSNLTLFLQVLAIALLVGGYFFIDFTKVHNSLRGEVSFVKAGCDVKDGECATTLANTQKLSLEVSPKSLPLMKPLTFTIRTQELQQESLEAQIYATNMFMGIQTITLKRTKQGVYEGKLILPTCNQGGMIWNADIIVNELTKRYGAKFEFKTE